MKNLKIFLFAVVLLAMALFQKSIFEKVLGTCAKLTLSYIGGYQFSYGEVKCQDHQIHFSHIALSNTQIESSSFQVDAEKASLQFDWSQFPKKLKGHLHVSCPNIFLKSIEKKSWNPKKSWLEITYSVSEGTLELPGIEKAQFSYDHSDLDRRELLNFRWGDSTILVQKEELAQKTQIKAELKQIRAALLNEFMQFFMPFDCEGLKINRGVLRGEVDFVWEEEKEERAVVHLEVEEFAFDFRDLIGEKIEGKIDWEGSIDGSQKLFDLFLEGHLRASISQMSLLTPFGSLKEVEGTFSAHPGIGSKWEVKGEGKWDGKEVPLWWEGRWYFHNGCANWIDTKLKIADRNFVWLRREAGEKQNWETKWNLTAHEVSFFQPLVIQFYPLLSGWNVKEGMGSGEAVIEVADGEIISWVVSQFEMEEIAVEKGEWLFCCEKLQGSLSDSKGEMVLLGGASQIPWESENWIQSRGWTGKFKWENGHLEPTKVEGIVQEVNTTLSLSGTWVDWTAKANFSGFLEGTVDLGGSCNLNEDLPFKAKIEKGSVSLHSLGMLENIEMEISAGKEEFICSRIKAQWASPLGKFSLCCPLLTKREDDWRFDFRIENQSWHFLRLAGSFNGGQFLFDSQKSQWLGNPLYFTQFALGQDFSNPSLKELDVHFEVAWDSILAATPLMDGYFPPSWTQIPVTGGAQIHLRYSDRGDSEITICGKDLQWEKTPILFNLHALEQEKLWKIEKFQLADIALQCHAAKENGVYQLTLGRGKFGLGAETAFSGKLVPFGRSEFILNQVRIDLNTFNPPFFKIFPLPKLEGILEGEGHLIVDSNVEMDFDFSTSGLKAGSFALENQGPIHFYFSSLKGMILRGLDLQVFKPDQSLPWVNCKIDHLQYDSIRSHWILKESQVHLAADFFSHQNFQNRHLRDLNLNCALDFIADFDWASDFSTLQISMKEGFIPMKGQPLHVQDLSFFWCDPSWTASCDYSHQGQLLKARLDVDLEPKIEGRLTLQDQECTAPLAIDWEYQEERGFIIQAIEGNFGGIEASFHPDGNPEGDTLIGCAKVDFGPFSALIDPAVARVFHELKMGKGYEFKGRLKPEEFSFQGILTGKQVELFGYQFRTLFAQVDLGKTQMKIHNLKISDIAGIMKIDEIQMEGTNVNPWTISIPQLTLLELRPSLLQKVGGSVGPISPLVVRELKMLDFRGLLDESKTYLAKGELHFINSYKREATVFDFPAALLSRIVGLDLDLLIPVCGTLDFELKEGLFHLTQLEGAFSEGNRSEFFLEKGESIPSMDLDGNLNILIKMKQFVLFKFTEAFLISIDGTLNDPQFHLQKRRRFFGL
ncbi:MAG: hypothetical protein V4487_03795 [Chlamydiota bacterium]